MHTSLKKLSALAGALLLATTAYAVEETTWAKIKVETFSPQHSAKNANGNNAAQHFFAAGSIPGIDADGNFGLVCTGEDPNGEPTQCDIDENLAGASTRRVIVNKAKVIVVESGQVTNLSGKAANFFGSTDLFYGVSDPDVIMALYPEEPRPFVVLTDKWHLTSSASGQTHVQATFSRNDLFPLFPPPTP